MTWPEYVAFLTGWAPRRHWECSFRRITEKGNVVFLELEERRQPRDSSVAANSPSVYELDDAGRIRHPDDYPERKHHVWGTRVSVSVSLGVRRILKKNKKQ